MKIFFTGKYKIWEKYIIAMVCKIAGIKKRLFCNNKETPMCAPLSL